MEGIETCRRCWAMRGGLVSVGAPTWRGLKQVRTRNAQSRDGISRCPDMEGIETRQKRLIVAPHARISRCPDMEGIETALNWG